MKNSLSKFTIILILLFLLFKGNYSESNENINQQSNSTTVDTLLICELLKLSSEDSLMMHLYNDVDYFNYSHKEIISLCPIKNDSITFYIRTIFSRYSGRDDYDDLGSFRILYKSMNNDSKIFKIAKDSIEIFIGSLDYYKTEQIIADINFDGFKDIILSFTQNTTGRNGLNHFYIFNPKIGQFIFDEQLNSLFFEQEIYIDISSKVISTGGRYGIIGFSGRDYRWNGSTYELFASNETVRKGDVMLYIHKEFHNGKWKVVKTDTI